MEGPAAEFAQQPLASVLEDLGARTASPGGGTATAMACSLAAGLVEMAARFDESMLAQARLVRAGALRERALELAERELTEYEPVIAALAMDAGDPQRETRLASAKAAAATTPLAIASIGAQIAALAAETAVHGPPRMVGEAVVAAELADGAVRAAAHMVRLNLDESPGDPRRQEVTGLVRSAAEALEEAFAKANEA